MVKTMQFEGYERHDLGERGIAFVRERLEWNRTLACLVLERGDLDDGEVFTYLPEGTLEHHEEGRLYECRWGILVNQNPIIWTDRGGLQVKQTLDHLLVRLLQSWLTAHPDRMVLFEEALFSADDRIYQEWDDVPAWFYRNEVYYPLLHSDRDEQAVEATLNRASGQFGLGFLTTIPHETEIPGTLEQLPESTMREISSRVAAIVVEAYDGEGFLIWQVPASTE